MENELPKSISGMMDEKFEIITERLDKIDTRLDVIEYKEDRNSKKLDDLQMDVKMSGRNIKKEIHVLKDKMDTIIELLKIHKIV